MKKLSIIIPCYNTEQYIEKCMTSIFNQTYQDYEVILIDDASTDNTWNKVKEYAKKNPKVRAFQNKENRGAAYSRNKAIKLAKYDYISFIDSDDRIEENYFECMMSTLEKEKSDIVACDIYVQYNQTEGNNYRTNPIYHPEDKLEWLNNGLAASPCNKIIPKEELLKYPFPEGIMNEDIPTILPIIIEAKKISYAGDTCYYYIQRKTSVQNSKVNEKRFDLFKALSILEERIERKTEQKKIWDAIIYNQVIAFLFYYLAKDENKKERKKYLKEFYQKTKKYSLRENPFLQEFYQKQGTKHRLYYKSLAFAITKGYIHIANEIIEFYHFYSKHLKKNVIEKEITIEKVIEKAKKQKRLMEAPIKISAVVPNYNYERFLLQRVYSILSQNIKLEELLLLDDCSTDNSRRLIDQLEQELKPYVNIRKIYNETNSGTAFKQWQKSFEEAKGDYVWIAEADDYCDKSFLENVVKPILQDKEIVLSYTDTAFIDKEGTIIMKTIKNEIDLLHTLHWNQNYIEDGVEEIKNYSYLNCTISNVSSVLFKKGDYQNFFEEAGQLKQAGDWLFYLNIMTTGKVAYRNKSLNYYRLHGDNVTSLTRKHNHLEEIKKIHAIIRERFGLTNQQEQRIQERYQSLEKIWKLK